jgi:HEAT repeat protein
VLLTEPRWQVVRDTVFVLGQIGGPAVVPLLARAGRHVDARVRRAAVEALGQVPAEQARPVLLSQLDSQDVRALRSALAMLARDPDAHSGDAVLARVLDPGFASRAEEQRLALLAALPDLAGDAAVPALAQSLGNGGWFAKPTAERSAAAGALQRLNTIAARGVLEQGLRHRAAAVREACEHALGQGPRA